MNNPQQDALLAERGAKVITADNTGQLPTTVLTRVLTDIRGEFLVEQIFSDASSAAIEELRRTA